MVTVQQIERGITSYMEQELAPKATGINKFAVYFMIPSVNKKVSSMIEQYRNNPIMSGYFTPEGNIDLDAVYSSAKSAIQKSGQIEFGGFAFGEGDITRLYDLISSTTVY